MTNKERKFLLDLQGFIAFSLANPNSIGFEGTLSAISNDVTVALHKEHFYNPRTTGHSKHLK